MLSLKVKKSKAEKARQYLEGLALLSTKHRIYGANSFIYLPIVQNADNKTAKSAAKLFNGTIEKRDFEPAGEKGAYRQLLHQSLGAKYDDVTKSYDLIGNIAVIDAKGKAAKDIAKAVMSTNKNVETVISKGGAVSGKYRTRKYLHIMGKRNFVAHYKENGAEFKFDIRKTFFSSRLAYDRLRIAKLVGKNENVVVMFAGMGPFAIEIAKMHKDANVVGIELNRSAYNYMKQNISLNHLHNATAVLGDVGKVAHKYKGFADRIIMPLPRDAYRFLGAALEMSKRKSTIHYYAFGDRESAFEDKIGQVKTFFAKRHRKIRIASKRIARQYSAKEVEVVLDIAIN